MDTAVHTWNHMCPDSCSRDASGGEGKVTVYTPSPPVLSWERWQWSSAEAQCCSMHYWTEREQATSINSWTMASFLISVSHFLLLFVGLCASLLCPAARAHQSHQRGNPAVFGPARPGTRWVPSGEDYGMAISQQSLIIVLSFTIMNSYFYGFVWFLFLVCLEARTLPSNRQLFLSC